MEAFRVLVGSQNYNLDTPESDEDYYIYHLPSFDQLYHNTSLVSEVKYDNGIYFHKDIRSLVNLIKKSSFNQLEILFSQYVTLSFNMEYEVTVFFKWLQCNRNEIVLANLPRLFQSTLGEINRRISDIEKDKYTEGTKHLFDKYGYDTKNAMHAFRLYNLLTELPKFNLYESEQLRTMHLDIKNGKLCKGTALYHLMNSKKWLENKSAWFDSHEVNNQLLNELETRIYDLVRRFAK